MFLCFHCFFLSWEPVVLLVPPMVPPYPLLAGPCCKFLRFGGSPGMPWGPFVECLRATRRPRVCLELDFNVWCVRQCVCVGEGEGGLLLLCGV